MAYIFPQQYMHPVTIALELLREQRSDALRTAFTEGLEK
jgi:hypothetical protein